MMIQDDWYYSGSPGDTVEDHKRQCPACRDLPGDMIIAHGQIIGSVQNISLQASRMTYSQD